jgi:segregation and condensation protein B
MEPQEVQPPQEAVDETLPTSDSEAESGPAAEAEPLTGTRFSVSPDAEPAPDSEPPPTPEAESPAGTRFSVSPDAEPAPDTETDPLPDSEIEPEVEPEPIPMEFTDVELHAILEAVIYIAEEPLEAKQIALALQQPLPRIEAALDALVEEFARPERGLQIREIAGGYKMATKPEHHEAVRQFVKNLKPSFKLTSAALETLAVIAYKQPITGPEIMEIRGVQGAGVLKTLLDRKLITTAGRKNVIGKPILYKTTKDFLVHFGLKSVNELPTLKEFEELRRLAFSEDEVADDAEGPASIAEAAAAEPSAQPDPADQPEAADPSEPSAPAEPPAPPDESPAQPAPEFPESQPESEPDPEPEQKPIPDTASEA